MKIITTERARQMAVFMVTPSPLKRYDIIPKIIVAIPNPNILADQSDPPNDSTANLHPK